MYSCGEGSCQKAKWKTFSEQERSCFSRYDEKNLENLLELRNVCIFALAYSGFFKVFHVRYDDIHFHTGYCNEISTLTVNYVRIMNHFSTSLITY